MCCIDEIPCTLIAKSELHKRVLMQSVADRLTGKVNIPQDEVFYQSHMDLGIYAEPDAALDAA
eukprot:1897226-Amphidinium_carterae.1